MEPEDFASALIDELESLPELKAARMRKLRREYPKRLSAKDA
jgi:hypothetical protein